MAKSYEYNLIKLIKLFAIKSNYFLAIGLVLLSSSLYADGGIGYKGININKNGTQTWYKAHNVAWGYNGCENFQFNTAADFSNQNFGSFTSSEVFQISGYAVVGWTNSNDWVAGKLLYKVWKQGDSEPETWSEIYIGNYGNGNGATQVVCTSGTDRVIGYDNGVTNINPGAPGTYIIKIQALGRMQWSGGSFNVNDGPEVTATFTIISSTTDQFRSKATGNWNTADSWESSSNGTNWATSTLIPGSASSSITIQSGHNITLDAAVAVPSITINAGGTFTASDATPRTLTIAKSTSGSSATLSNNGTWANGTGGSTVVFTGAPSSGDAIHAISGTIAFQNITVSKTGGSSNVGASFAANSSVTGTLEIGSGGYISTDPPASFYGSGAILEFNQGVGAIYEVNVGDKTWSTSQVPNNITITSGTVNLNDNRAATGDILINSKLVVNAGKFLTIDGTLTNNVAEGIELKSPADHGAPGSLITNGSIAGTGTIKAERYIEAYALASNGWHLISSPVNTPDIANNTNLAPGANDDFFAWNEVAYEWTNYKPGNVFTSMTNGTGYLVAYQTSATKYMTGVPNNSDVSYSNLSRTLGKGNGWHLVGNPFPSGIQWNNGSYALGSNIAGVAKVMNNNGSYSDKAANSIIPAMQGFFVQALNDIISSNTFTIPLNARVHDNSSWLKSDNEERFMLVAHDLETAMFQESVVGVNELATEGYDYQYDSRFWAWYAPQFYSKAGDEMLSTNTLPSIVAESTIPFGFVKNEASSFSIELKESIPGYDVYLNDLKTNQNHNLSGNPVYAFTSESGDDPNRFLLYFSPVSVNVLDKDNSYGIYAYGSQIFISNAPANSTITLTSITGQVLMRTEATGSGLTTLNAEKLPKGVYVVSLIAGGKQISRKVVL